MQKKMNEMQAKKLIYCIFYIYGLDLAKIHTHWQTTQPLRTLLGITGLSSDG